MIIAYFMSSMVTKRIGRLRLESHDYGDVYNFKNKDFMSLDMVLLDEQVRCTYNHTSTVN